MSKTIHVQTPFKLTLDARPDTPPRIVHVGAGIQTVEDEVADHWFTKAHLSNGGLGAVQYAEAQRDQADQAFVKVKEATALWIAHERATVDAEVGAGVELTSPAHERLAPTEEDAAAMSGRALDDYREAGQKLLDERRAAAPEADEPEPDEFDAMSDDQLRELITTRDGKAPRANTGRPKLLLAARGDQATKSEIENGQDA